MRLIRLCKHPAIDESAKHEKLLTRQEIWRLIASCGCLPDDFEFSCDLPCLGDLQRQFAAGACQLHRQLGLADSCRSNNDHHLGQRRRRHADVPAPPLGLSWAPRRTIKGMTKALCAHPRCPPSPKTYTAYRYCCGQVGGGCHHSTLAATSSAQRAALLLACNQCRQPLQRGSCH